MWLLYALKLFIVQRLGFFYEKKLITTIITIIINSPHIVLLEKPTHISWFDSELNLRKVLIAKEFFLNPEAWTKTVLCITPATLAVDLLLFGVP